MRSKLILFTIAAIAAASICHSAPQGYPSVVVKETYVHKYGAEVPASDWNARGRNGQIVSTMKDGVIISRTYANGMLDGPTTYTFPHSSSIEKVDTYVQGNLTKEVSHYRSGPPMQEIEHSADRSTSITTWYENGTPKSVEEYDPKGYLISGEYHNTNHQVEAQVEQRNGIRIIRNQYGLAIAKDTIQDGALTVRTTFHHNGNPREIIPYENGIVTGIRKTYLPDGEPNTIEMWSNGRQQGITIQFQNGEKFAEVNYINGLKHGVEHRYRDGQVLVEDISWYNDFQDGPTISYLAETPMTEWYFEGQRVSKSNYDLKARVSGRPAFQAFPQR